MAQTNMGVREAFFALASGMDLATAVYDPRRDTVNGRKVTTIARCSREEGERLLDMAERFARTGNVNAETCFCGASLVGAWTAGVHHGAHRCARVITAGA